MTSRRRTFLQIPQGTEAFYLEEAYRHRRIVSFLDSLYESWGYLPVHTPVFDFFDNYRSLLGDGALENVYRLIDREGDLLVLRSDITLFLAKQMGLALTNEDLPVRVYYSDVILRHQNREDISKNEFFQSGVELIGKAGKEADLEVMVLLLRIISELGLPAILHVGSRAVFDHLFQAVDEDERRNLARTVVDRDEAALRAALAGWESPLVDFACDLFGYIGDAEGLNGLLTRAGSLHALPGGLIEELQRLVELSRTLASVAGETSHRIDISEIGTQPYYTGVVFEAYMRGQDSAIASGGRYDRLLGFFGFPAASIGFSLLLRKVEDAVKLEERFALPETRQASGASFEERLAAADALRKKGKIALL